MADEQSDEKRINAEKAFALVGSMLGKIDERLDRHAERLANNDATLKAASDLIGIIREAVIDLQRRAGLREVGSKQAN